MEFIERLGLLATVAVSCVFWVFMFWRAFSRKRRGAMSRGRIVWLLLGGLSILAMISCVELSLWSSGHSFRATELPGFAVFDAWGATEIAIALRAAFARKRA
jgi:hypothetical protein